MTDTAQLEQTILAEVAAAGDEAALETVRVAALGKNGSISALLTTLGTMSPEERKTQGAAINGLKDRVNAALNARREAFKGAALEARLATETVDVTLPVRETPAEIGRIHPISQVIDELTAIFADMGFAVAEGPDIETDDYNFTKLNFPEDHPARRDARHVLLQSEAGRLAPAAAHPHLAGAGAHHADAEAADPRHLSGPHLSLRFATQTHTPMFHQVEGLVIDKGSHLGHLKWILQEFCKAFFEVDHVKMRFRPSFFPFTEPSLEVDIQCRRDKGEIRFGEGDDWLEILGCGMVHPNVLRELRHRSRRVSGLCLGHGHRPHRHAEIRHAGPARRSSKPTCAGSRHYGFRPLDLPTLAGGLSAMKFTLSWLKEHLDTDADARRDRRQADHDRARGRARRGQGARRWRPSPSRAWSRPSSIPMPTGCASAWSIPATAIPCRSCAARRMRAAGMNGVFVAAGHLHSRQGHHARQSAPSAASRAAACCARRPSCKLSDDHDGIIELAGRRAGRRRLTRNGPASTIR